MNLVFFTDRDLGTRFPDILATAGLKVERHRDHFPPDCPDEGWLRTIGSRGWVAVSHDKRIRYKPNELAAVVLHRVILLVVVGKAPFPQLARHFVATVPRIAKFLAGHTPPLIAKVYRPPSEALAFRIPTRSRPLRCGIQNQAKRAIGDSPHTAGCASTFPASFAARRK